MDSFDDDKIARLLRLKLYRRPPPGYFENFLHEFRCRQRQREELLREPLWSICVDRAHDFVFRHDVRPLAYYSAAVAAVVACAAVISITIYQQPDRSSIRSPELAGSNQVAEYRDRIGTRASEVDSSFRRATGCSSRKQQEYSDAARTAV